jgi:hypothetical protein
MLDCWNFRSDLRPSFSVIHEKLLYIYEKYDQELTNETLNINLNVPPIPTFNFSNSIGSSNFNNKETSLMQNLTLSAFSPKTDLNKQILMKRFSNNTDLNTILSRQSESEDSQYFSGTDMSNSLLYVDSSNFSTASSHYSATPSHQASLKAASIMANSLNKRAPSPPPPQTLETLLSVASKVYQL